MAADSSSGGWLTAKIGALTLFLTTLLGLADVGGRMISTTQPATCVIGFAVKVSLPWCGPRQKSYQLAGTARASSGGQDSLRVARSCEPPPAGWHFVPGTFVGIPSKGNNEGTEGGFGNLKPDYKPDVSPERVCFDVWADTHDARVTRSFEGTGSVMIER